jgi:hypothetical protein
VCFSLKCSRDFREEDESGFGLELDLYYLFLRYLEYDFSSQIGFKGTYMPILTYME